VELCQYRERVIMCEGMGGIISGGSIVVIVSAVATTDRKGIHVSTQGTLEMICGC
jgi:hypothetical protein